MSFREASTLWFLLILLNLLLAYIDRYGHLWWLSLMAAAFIAGVWVSTWMFHNLLRQILEDIFNIKEK